MAGFTAVGAPLLNRIPVVTWGLQRRRTLRVQRAGMAFVAAGHPSNITTNH